MSCFLCWVLAQNIFFHKNKLFLSSHSYLRRKAHQGAKASWGLEAQDAPYVKYIFYNGCFLFLQDFLAISWLFLLIFLLLLIFYKDYTVVGRIRTFFLELKHE